MEYTSTYDYILKNDGNLPSREVYEEILGSERGVVFDRNERKMTALDYIACGTFDSYRLILEIAKDPLSSTIVIASTKERAQKILEAAWKVVDILGYDMEEHYAAGQDEPIDFVLYERILMDSSVGREVKYVLDTDVPVVSPLNCRFPGDPTDAHLVNEEGSA